MCFLLCSVTTYFCAMTLTTTFVPICKKTCLSNKDNRAKVQFQQKTGSRSYTAHIYALVRIILLFFRLLQYLYHKLMVWFLLITSDSCWITFQKEERKGEPMTAIDFFKATHIGKTGYTEPVQMAVVSHLYSLVMFLVMICIIYEVHVAWSGFGQVWASGELSATSCCKVCRMQW